MITSLNTLAVSGRHTTMLLRHRVVSFPPSRKAPASGMAYSPRLAEVIRLLPALRQLSGMTAVRSFLPVAGANHVREIDLQDEKSCIHLPKRATSQTSPRVTDVVADDQCQHEPHWENDFATTDTFFDPGMNAACSQMDIYTLLNEKDPILDLEQQTFWDDLWLDWTALASIASPDKTADLFTTPIWGLPAHNADAMPSHRDTSSPSLSWYSNSNSSDSRHTQMSTPRRPRGRHQRDPELRCSFCNRTFQRATQLR